MRYTDKDANGMYVAKYQQRDTDWLSSGFSLFIADGHCQQIHSTMLKLSLAPSQLQLSVT